MCNEARHALSDSPADGLQDPVEEVDGSDTMSMKHQQTEDASDRDRHEYAAGRPDASNRLGIGQGRLEDEEVDTEEGYDRHHVEDSLHENRREAGGWPDVFLGAERDGSDDLTGSADQENSQKP